MFKRLISDRILHFAKQYKCLSLIGPRQSGKTTLCRHLFPNHEYFNFENPNIRDRFEIDPIGFLSSTQNHVIFDEVQNVPQIFSYLQEELDNPTSQKRYVLTGSNNLKLNQKISQSLAGRTKIIEILPLTFNEIPASFVSTDLNKIMFYGGYPRIFKEKLEPQDWLGEYFFTYVEKDIRSTLQIQDANLFNRFCRLLAGRVGQLVNHQSLAGDLGLSQPTAKSWLSLLETTYICFTLSPHFRNFNKRITKAPKIFFYDTGLLCYLLRIQTPEQLDLHPLRGQIFENWVISEALKHFRNKAQEAPLYFWRDQHGHEVDLVLDRGIHLDLYEIKSGATFQKDFLRQLNWLNKLQEGKGTQHVIYGGQESFNILDSHVHPWNTINESLFKFSEK